MPKRILLMATAGAAVLAFGGTAAALTIADSPSPTAGLGSVAADDPTTIPLDDPTPSDDPTVPADATTPSDDPTPGRSADDRTPGRTADDRTPAATGISVAQAKRIALDRTGDARVVDVELEEEHGRIVWKVETSSGAGVTRVDVDASSGAITRVRAESGGGGDDRGGDDDGGRGRGSDDPPGDDRGGDN
jgi:hypothetical protein